MPGAIATVPKLRFTDSSGTPLAGGTLTIYAAGTTTPANTWQDRALTTLNTNPITLDGDGACVVWLDSALSYKIVLKNSAGVTQWTQDNVEGGDLGDSIELGGQAIEAARDAAATSATAAAASATSAAANALAVANALGSVNFIDLGVLDSGNRAHTNSGTTLTGSARWFLGNATASSDDSALLIGRTLTGSYVTGAHAVRDESTYTSSGSGLHAYASFDSIITVAGAVDYNHLHNFQARSIYNGSGLLNQMSAFTNDPQVTGPVNAVRGLHVNNAAVSGAGTITEQSGVWVNNLTAGTTNYGVKLNLTADASRYSIHTGTAQSLFNGLTTFSAGLTMTGGAITLGSNQRINVASGTNFYLLGGGTIAQLGSLNDAGNSYQPMFLNASVVTFNTGSGASIAEAGRFDSNRNLLMGIAAGGTGGTQTICIETGTAPSDTPADTVSFYSSDHSAGHTIPSFRCEGTEVVLNGVGDVAATKRVRMRINGNIVSLLAE